MSTRIPVLAGAERPANVVVLLREAFVALNDLVLPRLAAHGHSEFRAAHGAVFQYLDDTGTTVSTLAERGRDVSAIAQASAPEIERRLRRLLGADRLRALKADLETIRHNVPA